MTKPFTAFLTITVLAVYGAQPAIAMFWTITAREYASTTNSALDGRLASADLNHDGSVDVLDIQRAAAPTGSTKSSDTSDDSDAPFTTPPRTIVIAAAITTGPIESLIDSPVPSASLEAEYELFPSFQRLIAHQLSPNAPPAR